MTVTLSTIGSRGVTFEAKPAALPEAAGGVTLWVTSPHEPDRATSYAFTRDEVLALTASMWRVIDAVPAGVES